MTNINLKVARVRKNLSQKEVSQITGISVSYIRQLEGGYLNNPTLEVMNKLANAYNCNLDDIFPINKFKD